MHVLGMHLNKCQRSKPVSIEAFISGHMKKLGGVKVCLLHSAVYVWVYVHMYVYYCVLSKPYLTASVPEHLLQWLQMINDC